jgi:hypothetical protein
VAHQNVDNMKVLESILVICIVVLGIATWTTNSRVNEMEQQQKVLTSEVQTLQNVDTTVLKAIGFRDIVLTALMDSTGITINESGEIIPQDN